jgi:hypothetical protein
MVKFEYISELENGPTLEFICGGDFLSASDQFFINDLLNDFRKFLIEKGFSVDEDKIGSAPNLGGLQ